ncbi:MAG: hypothetical protein M3O22_00735 [Pseudomonadota bacterium]|nr:hypothetical protein [Pseudomonadota bacterium]
MQDESRLKSQFPRPDDEESLTRFIQRLKTACGTDKSNIRGLAVVLTRWYSPGEPGEGETASFVDLRPFYRLQITAFQADTAKALWAASKPFRVKDRYRIDPENGIYSLVFDFRPEQGKTLESVLKGLADSFRQALEKLHAARTRVPVPAKAEKFAPAAPPPAQPVPVPRYKGPPPSRPVPNQPWDLPGSPLENAYEPSENTAAPAHPSP